MAGVVVKPEPSMNPGGAVPVLVGLEPPTPSLSSWEDVDVYALDCVVAGVVVVETGGGGGLDPVDDASGLVDVRGTAIVVVVLGAAIDVLEPGLAVDVAVGVSGLAVVVEEPAAQGREEERRNYAAPNRASEKSLGSSTRGVRGEQPDGVICGPASAGIRLAVHCHYNTWKQLLRHNARGQPSVSLKAEAKDPRCMVAGQEGWGHCATGT